MPQTKVVSDMERNQGVTELPQYRELASLQVSEVASYDDRGAARLPVIQSLSLGTDLSNNI